MTLSEKNVDITISDSQVRCTYLDLMGQSEWNINLLDDRLIFTKKGKERIFLVDEIKSLNLKWRVATLEETHIHTTELLLM